jgi:hypothetical protein
VVYGTTGELAPYNDESEADCVVSLKAPLVTSSYHSSCESIGISRAAHQPTTIVIRSNSGSLRGEVEGMTSVIFDTDNSTTELER